MNRFMGGELSWAKTRSEEEVKDCETRESEGLSISDEKTMTIIGIM